MGTVIPPSVLLSIDPGLRKCGCALFVDRVLVEADRVNSFSTENRAYAWLSMADAVKAWASGKLYGITGNNTVGTLAIELPQVYHSKIETDQNDLIQLSAVVGAIVNEFSSVQETKVYLPAEWKGQAPKEIVHRRAAKRLTPEELALIPVAPRSKKRDHNTMDGVSIGLVFLKRL